ncbi:MAG: hypothetical protein C0417_08920 [Chlorobiaceae bacterium]|nr:hypothetical protein [Chlorobiaceae bacterium]
MIITDHLRIIIFAFLVAGVMLTDGKSNIRFDYFAEELSYTSVNSIFQSRNGVNTLNKIDSDTPANISADIRENIHIRVDRIKTKKLDLIEPKVLLPFRTYTIKDGLVGNRVRALMQDSKGFIWIGTTEGLSVYDGTNFQNYSKANGFPVGTVLSIYESGNQPGNIWLSVAGEGVVRFSDDTAVVYKIGTENYQNYVFCFYEDPSGTLWCGTRYGLFYFADGNFNKINTNLKFESVKNIFTVSDSLMVIVSDVDCYLFNRNNNQTKLIPLHLDLTKDYTIDAIIDDDGDIWIGIVDGSLVRVHNLVADASYKIGNNYMQPGLDDGEGFIWAADVIGLLRIAKSSDIKQATLYTPANGLPHESYWAMLKDREGNLWFGNNSNGLIKLENQFFYHFPLENPKNAVIDQQNHIWVAMPNHLIEYWRESKGDYPVLRDKIHDLKNFDRNDKISLMTIDYNNRLIITTNDGTIQRLEIQPSADGGSFLKVNQSFALPGKNYAVQSDHRNRLWVAQEENILSFIDSPTNDRIKVSIPNRQNAHTIYRSPDSTVWFSLFENGLYSLKFTSSNDSQPILESKTFKDIHVRSILQTRNGELLIGTSGNGLFILQSDRIKNITTTDGLLSNTIWDIYEGNDDNIWLATSHGLCYLKSAQINTIHTIFPMYGRWIFKCGELTDGLVWGLSPDGLTIYDYKKDIRQEVAPPIYIRSVSINGNQVPFYDGMELTYDMSNCEINYVGISYKGERAVRYQYTIGENDTTWSQPLEHSRVTMAALKPGRYTFRVRAINQNGVVSLEPATWEFTILPPLWQRWWFTAIVVIFIGLMVYLIYRYRVNKILEMEHLRRHLASDLHDELATNLSSIAMFSNIVQENPQQQSGLLGRITTLAKESVDAVRDIIWTLDTKQETIGSLLTRLHDITVINCRARDFQLKFDLPPKDSLPSFYLEPETNKNLWLLLKEAVNNACKHSGCSEILIETTHRSGLLDIRVKDNGNGFDRATKTNGKGLETMKMRAEELGGKLEINSQVGNGTEILFQWKMKK